MGVRVGEMDGWTDGIITSRHIYKQPTFIAFWSLVRSYVAPSEPRGLGVRGPFLAPFGLHLRYYCLYIWYHSVLGDEPCPSCGGYYRIYANSVGRGREARLASSSQSFASGSECAGPGRSDDR